MPIEIDEIDPARFASIATASVMTPPNVDELADRHAPSPRSGPVGSFQYERLKRGADIALVLLLGLLSIPLVLLLSAFIALESGRPIFISQTRVGRWGRRFQMLKFRTLPQRVLTTSDRDWCVDADSRIMRFVRRTGIDELPQLLNVLRGEMSLIGPRPERPFFTERFEKDLPSYALRYQLFPGITGWAQVTGWRGNTSIKCRLDHDLYYLDHWALTLDLRIALRTLTTLLGNLSGPPENDDEGRRNARVI